jgi:hypothetical protein
MSNIETIYSELRAKGIPMEQIKPRENVLTFQRWRELGRVVKTGEQGVKLGTFALGVNQKTGGKYMRRSTTAVFHITQTTALN